MTDKEIAKWLVEMIYLAKKLPDNCLQEWKDGVREKILPERWENLEKLMSTIWKLRTLNEQEFLEFKKVLE